MATKITCLTVAAVALGSAVVAAAPSQAAAPRPTVTGVSAAIGRTTGGAEVTIAGANLGSASTVYFGSVTSTKITHVSSALIRVTSPTHNAGRVDVKVRSSAGTSTASPNDFYYFVAHSPHLSWSKPYTVAGTNSGPNAAGYLSNVSCAAADHCVMLSYDGHAYTWNTKVITRQNADVTSDITYTQLSCPTTTFCVAAGNPPDGEELQGPGSAIVLNGTTWGAPHQISGPNSILVGLDCSSSKMCIATDSDGHAVIYSGGVWHTPVTVFGGNPAFGVSCPTDTYCVLVSNDGRTRAYNGQAWTSIGSVYGLPANADLGTLSCPTTTYCVVNSATVPYIRRGNTWSKGQVGASKHDDHAQWISCAGTGLCIATGAGLLTLDGAFALNGAAASDTADPLPDGAISCASTTLCMVVHETQVSIAHEVS
jgi:IPT/TIG domain